VVPSREDIVTFHDPPPPEGESPWVAGAGPHKDIRIVEPDPAWPAAYDVLAGRIRGALGWRAIVLQHVGSTSVPGLPAKPVIDIDLVVADPDDETAYLQPLEDAGFVLRVREPWWWGHRALRHEDPVCNLHVFGPDSPEVVKHRLFRDWLRGTPADRDLYAAAKRESAAAANASGEDMMQYNARKEQVVRDIYHRAFVAMGLLPAGS
jgi:GrpB-like predicted nucleotidyltransferase (UPF0157 family)